MSFRDILSGLASGAASVAGSVVSRFQTLPPSVPTDPALAVDFSNILYDPSIRAHADCIDQKILRLQKYRKERDKYLWITLIPNLLDTLVWWNFGFWTGLGVGIGINGFLFVHGELSSFFVADKQYSNQAQELLEIYDKYLSKHGAAATRDYTIIAIAKALSGDVKTEELIRFYKGRRIDQDFSNELIAILSAPPHNTHNSFMTDKKLPDNETSNSWLPPGFSQSIYNLFVNNRVSEVGKKWAADVNLLMHYHTPKPMKRD